MAISSKPIIVKGGVSMAKIILKLSTLFLSLLFLFSLTIDPVYAADLSWDNIDVAAEDELDAATDDETVTPDLTPEELRKIKADRVARHMEKMREKVKKKGRETDLEVVEITDEEVTQIKKKIETGECRPWDSCSKCHKKKKK